MTGEDGRGTSELTTDLGWWWRPGRLFGVLLSLVGLVSGIAFLVTQGDTWQGVVGAPAATLSTQSWFLSDFLAWRRWRHSRHPALTDPQ